MSADNGSRTIDVYCRVRPPKKRQRDLGYFEYERERVTFNVPRDQSAGVINNQKERYIFPFAGVLSPEVNQSDVYEMVASPVVSSVLNGYNGTIFAYGQTGSGKTYSITGGAERYADRGIIPRAIASIFEHIDSDGHALNSFAVRISYLEIYNGTGYDLLDPTHDTKKLEDLPKVKMMEDEEGNTRLSNISSLPAASIEDALNLLFVGDTNRMICETPMNDASSRSHCIFIIEIEHRKAGSSTIRRSKLNLVDLAGSERVYKTRVDGKILTEATQINLSLHFLEQVIVALHQKAQGKRTHVPYRNSMIASVLKDSLGGNCRTAMIATISVEKSHIDESISTCRFAQRVAMIVNNATLNEELDPELVIKNLKAEIKELRAEISSLKGERSMTDLSPEEASRCRQISSDFMDGADVSSLPLFDERRARICCEYLRSAIQQCQAPDRQIMRPNDGDGKHGLEEPPAHQTSDSRRSQGDVSLLQHIDKLNIMLKARDNEISILVSMLKAREGDARAPTELQEKPRKPPKTPGVTPTHPAPHSQTQTGTAAPASATFQQAIQKSGLKLSEDEAQHIKQRNEAFEEFRKSYRKNQLIEANHAMLQDRIGEAKDLGAKINSCRATINALKSRIERCRLEQSMQSLAGQHSSEGEQSSPEEDRLKSQIEEEKLMYKANFASLKQKKCEIEHLQHISVKSRRRLQKDFDEWWEGTQRAVGLPSAAAAISTPALNPGTTPSGSTIVDTGDPLADAEIKQFWMAANKSNLRT